MEEIKIGDTVEVVANDMGNPGIIRFKGARGVVVSLSGEREYRSASFRLLEPHPITKHWKGDLINFYIIHLKLVKKDMTSLREKMALVFKGEPEKSFIKAGVMNTDETLTSDGQAVFMAWLLKENGTKFKSEVVDPILADMKKD